MKALTLLAALCLVAAPLVAQDTTHARHPSRRGAMARHAPMRGGDDQMMAMMREAAKAAHDAAGSDFKTHMDELSQAFQTASPDTAALRPHFDAAHAAMGKAHWAMLSAAARSRALLTDAQRQKVDAAVAAMSQREHM